MARKVAMSDVHTVTPRNSLRFFDNYLISLEKANIPEKYRRWYVKRIEEFIRAHNGHKIKGLSGADIARYFDVIGRENRLAGWQRALGLFSP
jgi:hypothetical protein